MSIVGRSGHRLCLQRDGRAVCTVVSSVVTKAFMISLRCNKGDDVRVGNLRLGELQVGLDDVGEQWRKGIPARDLSSAMRE